MMPAFVLSSFGNVGVVDGVTDGSPVGAWEGCMLLTVGDGSLSGCVTTGETVVGSGVVHAPRQTWLGIGSVVDGNVGAKLSSTAPALNVQ